MDSEAAPVRTARAAGGFYAITVVGSLYGHVVAPHTGPGHAAELVAGTANVVVTVLLYGLLRPVNRPVALLAVLFNVEGLAHANDPLAFFGCFCLCTGYLIFRSTFLPRPIGAAMALAGCGLLTIAYAPLLAPGLPHLVASIAFTCDGIGEISLTLWLLVVGIDGRRWRDVARLSRSATA